MATSILPRQLTECLRYEWGTPPLINDASMSRYAEQVILNHFGSGMLTHVAPTMGGEDFSFYLQKKPGAYLFVGMGGDQCRYPHHHPRFDIDEEVLPTAIELFIHLAKDFQ